MLGFRFDLALLKINGVEGPPDTVILASLARENPAYDVVSLKPLARKYIS